MAAGARGLVVDLDRVMTVEKSVVATWKRTASPAWEAEEAQLFFWFVRDEDAADFEGTGWAELLKPWLELVPPSDRFTEVQGQVVTLEDMTAAEYIGSDLLDLDHLSGRAETAWAAR